jgi:hypothetical protein
MTESEIINSIPKDLLAMLEKTILENGYKKIEVSQTTQTQSLPNAGIAELPEHMKSVFGVK